MIGSRSSIRDVTTLLGIPSDLIAVFVGHATEMAADRLIVQRSRMVVRDWQNRNAWAAR